MARPLTPLEKDRARSWMKERRGETSQDALAKDITSLTGWHIGRDRYSKYESGGTDFGRGTLDKLIAYWAKKGKAGPDLTPPEPAKPPVDMADALMAIAASNTALAKELREAREERATLVAKVEEMDLVLRNHVARTNADAVKPPAPHETAV